MSKLFYFKVTFLSVSAGLFVGRFVYGAFDLDFSSTADISRLFIKSIATGLITGFVLGILNMFFKIGNFPRRKS